MGVISKLPYGGKEKHYATIMISTEDFAGRDISCVCENVGYSKAATFDEDGHCSFEVYDIETYTLTCGDRVKNIKITTYYVEYNVQLDLLRIVDWANGSWEDIQKMIKAHYEGDINVADYWAVGDKRPMSLPDMGSLSWKEGSSLYVMTQPAQDVELTIIGFNHDDLADGSGKACITVQQRTPLTNETFLALGNKSKWSECNVREWLMSNYYEALPIKDDVKEVIKLSSYGLANDSHYYNETTTDKVFLISLYEAVIPDGVNLSIIKDGDLYEYYQTPTNLLLNDGYKQWWLRTTRRYSSSVEGYYVMYRYYYSGKSYGYVACTSKTTAYCIMPAFCL